MVAVRKLPKIYRNQRTPLSAEEKKLKLVKKLELRKMLSVVQAKSKNYQLAQRNTARIERAEQRRLQMLEEKRLKAEKRAEMQETEDRELHEADLLANRAEAGEALNG